MPCAMAFVRNIAIHRSNAVPSALAPLGAIRLAKPPAMAFNEARLARFGAGNFMLMGRFAFLGRYNSTWQRDLRRFRIDGLTIGCNGAGRGSGDDRVPDDPPAPADQVLVGRDQRHIGIDE